MEQEEKLSMSSSGMRLVLYQVTHIPYSTGPIQALTAFCAESVDGQPVFLVSCHLNVTTTKQLMELCLRRK